MHVAAIMPCRGRAAQTVENVQRLLATTGYQDWWLVCVVERTEQILIDTLVPMTGFSSPLIVTTPFDATYTYWDALAKVTQAAEPLGATHLINLANDLWACDDWLKLAVAEYQEHFDQGDGLLGFAGDGHGSQHSCHFLISRPLLERYGGWPTWYSHNFGDTELCTRAQQDGVYHKSTTAWLEHCHPMLERAADDAVYQAGRATYQQDQALFTARRAVGWPHVSR